MTHAGESYGAVGEQALAAFAEQERAAVVAAAAMLRDAGLPCPVVSVGSSPTAHFARNLDGVTEVRAGVKSEEHTSELQSLMRISYAVFCLKKKKKHINKYIDKRSTPKPLAYE